jgi:hypothetical protein
MCPETVNIAQRWMTGLPLLVAVVGCSMWQAAEVEISELPATRLSDDSVVWEIQVAYVGADETDFHDQLWLESDEQHLPIDTTLRLESNGFRTGLLGMPLPTVLRARLDEQKSGATDETGALPIADLRTAFQCRRLQARRGQRYEILGTEVHHDLVALLNENGEIRAERFGQAQCVLALRSFPSGDGRVKLEVTPEIHYGQPQQHYTGRSGVFQVESKRDAEVLDDLRFEAMVSPGQTLLLTTTREAKGLGNAFFTESIDGRQPHKLILLRLAQTQYDDRFDPGHGKPALPLVSEL